MAHCACRTLLILLLCTSMLACSTQGTKQPDTATPLTTYAWETRLPGAHEKIEITYRLPQHASATFMLSKDKEGFGSAPLAVVKLSNEDCQSGHQVALTFNNKGVFYTRYFTRELSWSSHNTITIQQLEDTTLQVVANDEVLSIPMNKLSRWLKVSTQDAPIEIQKVKYISE
jgi:hypothetical protein